LLFVDSRSPHRSGAICRPHGVVIPTHDYQEIGWPSASTRAMFTAHPATWKCSDDPSVGADGPRPSAQPPSAYMGDATGRVVRSRLSWALCARTLTVGTPMFNRNRTTWALRARAVPLLCAAFVAHPAMAASPKLESIAVTPVAKTIFVGQKQRFTATGTFSNGSKQALGPALSNMALGFYHACALLSSGGVECWGNNSAGGLGDGSTTASLIPRPVKRITTATAVATSQNNVYGHSCALLRSGAVQCWGLNTSGQLGNGMDINFEVFPVAVGGIRTATAVAAGARHSCALLAGGAVKCWGHNSWGSAG
jgi:hypothetical protein